MPKEAEIVWTTNTRVWVSTGVWVLPISQKDSDTQTLRQSACWWRCWHTLKKTNKLSKYGYSLKSVSVNVNMNMSI